MLRWILLFFCKSKLKTEYKNVFEDILKSIDKKKYKENRDFIIQVLSYYIEKGNFTDMQKRAIKRAANG